ncbi:MAG: glycerate kinase [Candidatus Dormibacteria bacterium]
MKLVVAPTAYKGTMSPREVADAMTAGIASRYPRAQFVTVPISDGGDGFLECLEGPLGASRRSVVVRGPLHSPLAAAYAINPQGVAVIETAAAIGMARLPARHLDAMGASSGGLGELMAEARQAGAGEFLLGLGGSASTDGGTGMARALGYRFLDRAGRELPEGGGYLGALDHVDAGGLDPGWLLQPIRVACDVDNPLLGPDGCAATYAPQKGATPAQVARLEAGLWRLAEVVLRDLGFDMRRVPFGGAAGGLGAGLAAFLGAELRPGAGLVLETVRLPAALRGVDALVTGEGRLDRQSLFGKAPVVAGRLGRAAGVRSVALVGSTGDGWEAALGDAFDVVMRVPPPEAGETPASTLTRAAALTDLGIGG